MYCHQGHSTISGIGRNLTLKKVSIRYIVRYTKNISNDRGNAKKLLPRVGVTPPPVLVRWLHCSRYLFFSLERVRRSEVKYVERYLH